MIRHEIMCRGRCPAAPLVGPDYEEAEIREMYGEEPS